MNNTEDGERPCSRQGNGDIIATATDSTLERFVVPLTVVHAHLQLLQRRLERGQPIELDALQQTVTRMETAASRLVEEFRTYTLSTSGNRHHGDPEVGDEAGDGRRGRVMGSGTGTQYETEGGRATPEQMQRKHVYVVNGSPEFLDIVRQLLQDENYNVTTTNFVPLSFETIQSAQPSLLIIDLVIGEQAGWDLLTKLRQGASTRDIPILLVSTRPELLVEVQDRHEEFGGDRYLLKPFDLDDLLRMIDELIGEA